VLHRAYGWAKPPAIERGGGPNGFAAQAAVVVLGDHDNTAEMLGRFADPAGN
jgi:hypothetical protein